MIEPRPPKIIDGERIRLEARKTSQAAELFALIEKNREKLKPWMPWEERTKVVADSQAFIEGTLAGWELGETFDYAIYLKSTGQMIGAFGLHTIDGFNKRAHLGFWIDKDHEGQGYVSEAVRLGEMMAAELGLHRLTITCNRLNKKSEAVALRNGYRKEATAIDEAFEKGQWRDTSFFVKFVSTPDNLPAGFHLREVSDEEWSVVVKPRYDEVFEDELITLQPESYLGEAELEAAKKVRDYLTYPNRRRIVLYYGEELAGWSEGLQDARDSFSMQNSAIIQKFRGRGLYGMLLDNVVDWALKMGFQKIQSRHRMTNNAILIQKLRKGFHLTGFELNDITGPLVHMTYFASRDRGDVLNFRAGARPSAKIKPLVKL